MERSSSFPLQVANKSFLSFTFKHCHPIKNVMCILNYFKLQEYNLDTKTHTAFLYVILSV